MLPDSTSRSTKVPRFSWRIVTLAGLAVALVGAAAYAYVNSAALERMLLGIFGPPAVTMREAYQVSAEGPRIDHARFDALLHAHVKAAGAVDYHGLQRDVAELDAYLAMLATAPFDQLGRDEKLALLINAYNAFTLRLILEHFNDGALKSIRDLDEPWDQVRWSLGGKTYSLNQIEHEQIRPKFKEPRIHFALVCAAVGCPILRSEAYQSDRIDQQLEEQSKYVHEHDRWFRFDPEKNRVWLTRLYLWYGDDFVQASGSVLDFAAHYSSAPEVGAGRRQESLHRVAGV